MPSWIPRDTVTNEMMLCHLDISCSEKPLITNIDLFFRLSERERLPGRDGLGANISGLRGGAGRKSECKGSQWLQLLPVGSRPGAIKYWDQQPGQEGRIVPSRQLTASGRLRHREPEEQGGPGPGLLSHGLGEAH